MEITGVTNSGALPALAQLMRFSAQRQRLLAHNIANATTPNFQPIDVDPREFQRALGQAVDERRAQTGGMKGQLSLPRGAPVKPDEAMGWRLDPKAANHGVLFHDRNNRDLERMMQDLAENAGVFRAATELMRSQGEAMARAMRESP